MLAIAYKGEMLKKKNNIYLITKWFIIGNVIYIASLLKTSKAQNIQY